MVGKEIDPSDIGKFPKLIKAAQQDMTQTDVLVCGRCHTVFNFIDLFKEHKEKSCVKESNLKDCRETKPKVWAFLLWKAAQLNNTQSKDANGHMNSWKLYQTWVKMEESIRETWVVAGKTIQSFARMGQGSLQEMPVKITKTVVDSAPAKQLTQSNRIGGMGNVSVVNRNLNRKDDSMTDEEQSPTKTNDPKKLIRTVPMVNKTPGLVTSTPINRPIAFSRRARRTIPNSQETELETVEKIVAKRFNPRRKMHEYLVKWENFTHDQNTWEPQTHLEGCPQLLDTFEKQLARQKEQRAQAAAAKVQQTSNKADDDEKRVIGSPMQNRPVVRTVASSGSSISASRAKALDQVNKWMGQEDKSGATDSDSSGLKRKLDDTDFDGTAGEEEDFEEDSIPVHAVKRLKNGTTVTTKSDPKGDLSRSPTIIKTFNVNGSVKSSPDTSAEVVITKDSSGSGILRKVGVASSTQNSKPEAQIRILSKGENTTSGIVRLNSSSSSTSLTSGSSLVQKVGGIGGIQRVTPQSAINKVTTVGRANVTTPQVHRINVANTTTTPTTVKSLMQPKTITQRLTPTQQVRQIQTQPRQTTIIQRTSPVAIGTSSTSPQSGKMIINRNIKGATPTQQTINKSITPEQKIMQLSKSGDIKVTRKTVAQHSPVQQQIQVQSQPKVMQMGQRRPQQQQQSVQQRHIVRPKMSQRPESPPNSGGLTLCPITGKILTESGEEIPQTTDKKDDNQGVAMQLQLQQEQGGQEIGEGLALTTDEHGQQILANEDGTPLLVTGEDGTIYQVAGKNAEGQTILIAQGSDGEQQYAYVAAADDGEENSQEATAGGVLTLDNAVAEAVAQMIPEQDVMSVQSESGQFVIKQDDGTLVTATTDENAAVDPSQALSIQTDGGDSQDANIPAEVVQADLPSPGGTRRVILLLQDGTFMMTEMHDDEYQALNITET